MSYKLLPQTICKRQCHEKKFQLSPREEKSNAHNTSSFLHFYDELLNWLDFVYCRLDVKPVSDFSETVLVRRLMYSAVVAVRGFQYAVVAVSSLLVRCCCS